MAYLNFRQRSRFNWVPDDYTANEVDPIGPVVAGELIGPFMARTRVVFNGSGTDAIIEVGDGGDVDRFIGPGNVDETTTGLYLGLGGAASNYLALGHHLYTAADNIDVNFTANTAGTRTTGTMDYWWYSARVDPH
jgi:hypothetical protein